MSRPPRETKCCSKVSRLPRETKCCSKVPRLPRETTCCSKVSRLPLGTHSCSTNPRHPHNPQNIIYALLFLVVVLAARARQVHTAPAFRYLFHRRVVNDRVWADIFADDFPSPMSCQPPLSHVMCALFAIVHGRLGKNSNPFPFRKHSRLRCKRPCLPIGRKAPQRWNRSPPCPLSASADRSRIKELNRLFFTTRPCHNLHSPMSCQPPLSHVMSASTLRTVLASTD